MVMADDEERIDGYELEQFRPYLRLLAEQQAGPRLRGNADLSGVVQETLFEAHREFARGVSVALEHRLAWLRRILANNLADAARRLSAEKRDVGRVVSLQQALEQSSRQLDHWLAVEHPSLSPLERDEQALRLAAALSRLSDAQREAVALHYLSGMTVAEVAERLGRTRDAAAGLIRRGIRQMRVELKNA
jgi:RNA polymerase sigma-70 factor (ECF subfamily)